VSVNVCAIADGKDLDTVRIRCAGYSICFCRDKKTCAISIFKSIGFHNDAICEMVCNDDISAPDLRFIATQLSRMADDMEGLPLEDAAIPLCVHCVSHWVRCTPRAAVSQEECARCRMLGSFKRSEDG
jgi:hypothetical protein